MRRRGLLAPLPIVLAVALATPLAACKRSGGGGGDGSLFGGPTEGSTGAPSASAGPMVAVPAGSFRAGTPCGGVPRITNEELVGPTVSIGAFSIDVYPYPNDPSKPARVDVSRDEAEAACAERGKRLCTELEWERACKGPQSTTFEYGAAFDANACKNEPSLLPGKRAKCTSAFGVKDQHGLVFEWTKSAWGRGTGSDLGTVRGGPGGVLQDRCANGQSRPPGTRAKDVGFRCCAGPVDPATVDLTLRHDAPVVEEPSVEDGLSQAMLRAMPREHQSVAGARVAFEKLWRWHPRDNEELLVGRWTSRPSDGGVPSHVLAVFKVCGNVPSLVAHMRGPVADVGAPGASADPQKIGAHVATSPDQGEVKLDYWYGSVKFEHPDWLKNGLVLPSGPRPPMVQPKGPVIVPKRR
jgi:hypothetical protein